MKQNSVSAQDYASKAKALTVQGDHESAKAVLLEGISERPKSTLLHLDLVRNALASNDADRAETALEAAKELGADVEKTLALDLRLAIARQDWHATADLAQQCLELGILPVGAVFRQVIRSFRQTGQAAAEEEFTRAVAEKKPDVDSFVLAYYQAVCANRAMEDLPAFFEKRIFAGDGAPHEVLSILVYMRDHAGFSPQLSELLERARKKWPDHPSVKRVLAEVERSGFKAGEAVVIAVPEVSPTQSIPLLFDAYKVQLATRGSSKSPEELKLLRKAMEGQFAGKEFQRPLLVDDGTNPVLVSPPGPSGKTILIFGGLRGDVGFPLGMLDMYFATRGVTTVMLRDTHRDMYLTGASPNGATYSEFVTSLKNLIATLPGHEELYVMGISGGGFGAMNVTADLQAKHLLLYSAATNATEPFLREIGDIRAAALQQRLKKIQPKELIDPKTRIMNAGHKPHINSYYSEGQYIDKLHSEDLLSLENATSEMIEECKVHIPFDHLIKSDLFDAQLDVFFA